MVIQKPYKNVTFTGKWKTWVELYLLQAEKRLFVQLIFKLLRHSRNPLYSFIVIKG